ncbi:MAG: hypothetical protein ACI88C_000072 [Acidimicrobiales bacterium]|jgi:hypothetical protein
MRTGRQPLRRVERTVKIGIKKDRVYLINGGGGEPDEEIADFGKRSARSIAAAQRVAQNERCTMGRRPEFIPEILDIAELLVRLEDEKSTKQLTELLRDALGKSRMFEKRYMSELARLEPAGMFLRGQLKDGHVVNIRLCEDGDTDKVIVEVDEDEYSEGVDLDEAMLNAHKKDVEA